MGKRTIGKNQLAPRQVHQRVMKRPGIGQDRNVYIMHIIKKIRRIDIMIFHQPVKGRSIFVKVVFLQLLGVAGLHIQAIRDKLPHLLVNLRKKIAAWGIKRVVQIENPVVNVRELLSQLFFSHERNLIFAASKDK